MKILHANFAKGFRGGERQTELLVRALASHSDVSQGILVRHDSPLIDKLSDIEKLSVHTVKKPYIRKTIALEQYDFVQAHETKAAQWALVNFKRKGTPYVVTRRVPNPIKENFFTRSLYHSAQSTICLSQEIKENLLKTAPEATTHIIADMRGDLPVDIDLLDGLKKRYDGKTIVGNAGALVKKHKGQHVLIEVARQLQHRSDLHFLILGEGYDREALEQQADGLSNVEFLGFQEKIGTYLRLFDVFAFPSLEEGMGSTLLDVMQAEKPIVASDVGGIPEIVTHGKDGLLVPAGDADSLRQALEKLLDDNDLSKQLVAAGAQTVQKFSPQAIGEQYLALYRPIFE